MGGEAPNSSTMDKPAEFTGRPSIGSALTSSERSAAEVVRQLTERFDQSAPIGNLQVDHIAFLFADLNGSTELYEKIGDAEACNIVRQLFAVMAKAISVNSGAIVKTIGDAVHAAFSRPRNALLSAIQIQRDIEAFNTRSGRAPINVKIGLHAGCCIALTMNNQLDFYGAVVNKAARLAGQCSGGDIVVSNEMAAEPLVERTLRLLEPVMERANLKGFVEPITFIRIPTRTLVRDHREMSDCLPVKTGSHQMWNLPGSTDLPD